MSKSDNATFGSSGLALLVFLISVIAYGWQMHGIGIGFSLGVLFLILVFSGNAIALLKFESLKLGTYFRWAFFLLIMIGIGISGTQICDADGQCSSLI